MTCKSCIHFDACSSRGKTQYYGMIVACNDVEERCKNFINKSDMVDIKKELFEKLKDAVGLYEVVTSDNETTELMSMVEFIEIAKIFDAKEYLESEVE